MTDYVEVGLSHNQLKQLPGNRAEDEYLDRYKDFAHMPTPTQKDFAKDLFYLVCSDTDDSYITAVPARCGIGKSICCTAIASYFSTYYNYMSRGGSAVGIIIVTDKLKRLEDYQAMPEYNENIWFDEKDIKSIKPYSTYLNSESDETAQQQLIKAQYKPIVLLSTQRYFSMTDEWRESLLTWRSHDKKKHNREIVIFDEKPYFYETLHLDVRNFNDVSTALQNGIPDKTENREQKDWILEEYRSFRDRMEKLLRDKEKTQSNADRFYWHNDYTQNITSNDDKFFKLVNEYKSSIIAQYLNAIRDLQAFKRLMTEGAFFTTIKKTSTQEYRTYFELYQSNKDKFYLNQGKVKCFILDATADTDPDYEIDYVEMYDCAKYNDVQLKANFHFYNVNSSKSHIVNKTESKQNITQIHQCLEKLNLKDVLLATYKNIEDQFGDLQYKIAHFGDLKGSNLYNQLTQFVQVGTNRYDAFQYLVKMINREPEIIDILKNKNESESRDLIKEFCKTDKGIFISEKMNEIMLRSILCDFEQNIYRTAIRNFTNDKQVTISTYWNYTLYGALNKMIEDRFAQYGAIFKYCGIPASIQQAKLTQRKSKSGQTNPQKILDWLNSQPKGKEFKTADMLSETGMNNKKLDKIKRTHSIIKEKLNSYLIPNRRGYYKIN